MLEDHNLIDFANEVEHIALNPKTILAPKQCSILPSFLASISC